MEVLKRHPDFEYMQMNDESILSVPGLEIYPSRRKIYRGRKEISLTAKEYDLFYFLVVNRGQVLTYGQIYQNVWNRGHEPVNQRPAGRDDMGKELSGRDRTDRAGRYLQNHRKADGGIFPETVGQRTSAEIL